MSSGYSFSKNFRNYNPFILKYFLPALPIFFSLRPEKQALKFVILSEINGKRG